MIPEVKLCDGLRIAAVEEEAVVFLPHSSAPLFCHDTCSPDALSRLLSPLRLLMTHHVRVCASLWVSAAM